MTASHRVEGRHLVWPYLSENLLNPLRSAIVVSVTHTFVPVLRRPEALNSKVEGLVKVTSGQDERHYEVMKSSLRGLIPSSHRDQVFRTAG